MEGVHNLRCFQRFLEEKNNPNSLVKKISKGELAAREQRVEGRMKRKVLALRQLLEGGAATVMLGDGRTEHPVLDALNGKGTTIE